MAIMKSGENENNETSSTEQGAAQNVNQNSAGTEEAIDPNHSSAIMGNWFVATPYLGRSVHIGKQLKFLNNAVNNVIESMKGPLSAHGIVVGTRQIRAGDGNPLISDTLCIHMIKNKKAAIHSIIIHNPTERIEPYKVTLPPHIFGVTDLEAARHRGALGSKVHKQYVEQAYLGEDFEITGDSAIRPCIIDANIVETSPGVYSFGTSASNSDLEGIIRRIIQTLSITLGIKVLGEFEDMTIDKIKDLGGVIGINVDETNDSFNTPDGVLRHSKAVFSMHILDSSQNQVTTSDPHNAQASNHIGTAYVNTECRFIGGQQISDVNLSTPTSPVIMNSWCPTLILEYTESSNMPSLGVETMLSAIISGFMTTDILMSLFDDDIRFLNMISNITKSAKQSPITRKVISEYWAQSWKGLMTPYWSFGIRIPEGSVTYGTQGDWIDMAHGTDSYLISHLNKILFGDAPSLEKNLQQLGPKNIVQGYVDVSPQGTYVDSKGNTIPLSNIDVRFWLAMLAEKQIDQSVVSAWMAACSMYTREERYAIKSKLILDFIPSAVITGMDYTVYLGDVISLLQQKIIQTCSIKASGATTYQNITWNVHGAAGSGISYVGGQQSQYPPHMMPQAGYPGYGFQQ